MNSNTWFGASIGQCRALLAVAAILLAVGTTAGFAQSTLGEFGISEADLKSRTVSALLSGAVPIYPNRDAFKSASQSLRAAFVRSVFSVVKNYAESAAFQAEYAERRAEAKPSVPAAVLPDELYAEYLAKSQQDFANMKAEMAKMPPDIQKQMESMVKQLEEDHAKLANDPQMVSMMKQSFAMQAENKQQAYNEALDQYEKRYPADPKVLIASRLRGFLELSDDIPYNAELVPGDGGKMKFADSQFEANSQQWKMCYRAGKEPVEAARALAMEWLEQLEQ